MAAHTVDGTDLEACLKTVGNAVTQAREGNGPQLVVARLLRLCGHGEHDDAGYIPVKLKQSALGRDCLKVSEQHLLTREWADEAMLKLMRDDALHTVEEAVAQVQREPATRSLHRKTGARSRRGIYMRFLNRPRSRTFHEHHLFGSDSRSAVRKPYG